MSEQFLSLAMSEANPGTGNFNVIAVRKKTNQFVVLDLTREDIEPEPNHYLWDIGKITEVDDYIYSKDANDNYTYHSFTAPKLLKQSEDLKKYLDKKTITTIDEYRVFKNKSKDIIAIVKPEALYSIPTCPKSPSKNAPIQNHLELSLDGFEFPLLNKDFRWLNYWTYLFKNDLEAMKTAQDRYLRYLNSSEKTLYLVMYKRYFGHSSYEAWIAGMHFL